MNETTTFVPVLAYLGPGGALSAIGSFLALVGAILLAVIGFLWYPIKRLLRRRREHANPPPPPAPPHQDARG